MKSVKKTYTSTHYESVKAIADRKKGTVYIEFCNGLPWYVAVWYEFEEREESNE